MNFPAKSSIMLAAAMAVVSQPALAWRGSSHHNNYYNSYPAPVAYAPPGYATANYHQAGALRTTKVVCNDSGSNPLTGIIGGALGGVAGNGIGKGHGRTAAIITGAVLGTTIGASYGGGTRCTEQVVYQPAPPPPTYVQQVSTVYTASNYGRYCREYQNVSTVAGRPQQTYGTACMQPDGSWEIID